MLHDAIPEVVDSEAALEFMKEATKLATSRELEEIGAQVEQKGALFARLLDAERIGELSEDEFRQLVGAVFSIRLRSRQLIKAHGIEALRQSMGALLFGSAPLEERFNTFIAALGVLEERLRINLASEILHFSNPRKYWLWTNWIWDPTTGMGALPLVVQEEVDLKGTTPGATYLKVGAATARVDAAGHQSGFSGSARGLYGTDIFLACVYAVYMYTVFKIKLSQEFNRILPELPELTQRVLGVHQREWN